MLKVGIDKILPVTEARARIAKLVDEVERGNIYVLTRGGKPAAVVVPIDKADKILSDVGNVYPEQSRRVENVKQNKEKPVEYQKKTTDIIREEPKTDDIVVKPTDAKAMMGRKEEQTLPTVDKSDEKNMTAGIDMNKVNEELAKYNK